MLHEDTLEGRWRVDEVLLHPFGSFRHRGAFPASLIGGSATSRHLRAASIDFQSYTSNNELAESLYDASTHLYINMLDSCNATNSRQLGNESRSESDVSINEQSEFSSIHSQYGDGDGDGMLDDFLLADHRIGDECTKGDESSWLTGRKVISHPIDVSIRVQTNDSANSPSFQINKKCAKSAFAKSNNLNNNVVTWLDQVNEVIGMTPVWRERHVLKSAASSHIQSSTSYCSTVNMALSLADSGNISFDTTDKDRAISAHRRDSEKTFVVNQNENSINSDTASFTNRPLVVYGVSGRKLVASKREKFCKKMRKFGNLLKRKSRKGESEYL